VVLDPHELAEYRKGHAETKNWGAINLRRALNGKLAKHKIPQVLRVVDELPKNAMGKGMDATVIETYKLTRVVNKKGLIQQWTKDSVIVRKIEVS
jgi:acyl-CoA synthetase (AMP-forming)/AMP-acid ligase II